MGGWWNGRHEGLKIPSLQGGEGSTPSPPISQIINNLNYTLKPTQYHPRPCDVRNSDTLSLSDSYLLHEICFVCSDGC